MMIDLPPQDVEILRLLIEDWKRRLASDEENENEADPDRLSDREFEILTLQASGYTRKQIAQICDITPDTVKIHIFHIYQKLRVVNAPHASIVAHQKRIIDLDQLKPSRQGQMY